MNRAATAASSAPAGVIRWGDLPVPYVAAWSSEQGWRVDAGPKGIKHPLLFTRQGRRGLGKPMFGKMDPARVRQVVSQHLCQVCARPLRGVGYIADVVIGEHQGCPIVNEPAACRHCFAIAILACPGIARQREKKGFLAAIARSYHTLLVKIGPVEGGDPVLNAALQGRGIVYGYARPALIEFEPIDLDAVREVPAS